MLQKFLVFLFLVTALPAGAQTFINASFIYGGIRRTYTVYVPAAYCAGKPVPLVMGLHGLGSSGEKAAALSGVNTIADTANFIAVYPDGTKQKLTKQRFWNYGNIMGSKVDDEGFLLALLDTLTAQYSIDEKRMYCVGMSNGSFMAYLLACHSSRFAAIAAVTGGMSVNMYSDCRPAQPIPVLHIHGTADRITPYNGTSTMAPVEAVVELWAAQNKCDTHPVVLPVPDSNIQDGATAERIVFTAGISGHMVVLIRVQNGGHAWPGKRKFGLSGRTCMDFDAAVEIWKFLAKWKKEK